MHGGFDGTRRRARATAWIVLAASLALASAGAARAGELRMTLTNLGAPLDVPDRVKFYVYPQGERDKYVDWGHAERAARVPDDVYDVVVRFEAGFVVRTKTFEKLKIEGVVEREVDFDVPLARLTLELTLGGRPLPKNTARVAVYRPGERGQPIGRSRPGETMILRPGTYDLELAWMTRDGLQTSWLTDFPIDGAMTERVSVGTPTALLKITLRDGGRIVPPDEGVWRAYRPGDRDTPIAERGSGMILSLDEGVYDLELRVLDEDPPRVQWLEDVAVRGETSRDVDLRPSNSLRVDVRVEGPDGDDLEAWFGVFRRGERATPLSAGRSGESVRIDPGVYDVGAFARRGAFRAESWTEGLRVEGNAREAVAVELRPAYLQVDQRDRRRDRTDPLQPRLLVLFDRSARMGRVTAGGSWSELAASRLAEALGTIGGDLPVGLVTYGGREGGDSCRAQRTVVPVDRDNREALAAALAGPAVEPAGEAPLAFALRGLASEPGGPGTVLLIVTDNAGSCPGDACAAASDLLRAGRVGRILVLGLGLARDERRRLECVGTVLPARTPESLDAVVRDAARIALRERDGTVAIFEPGADGRFVAGGAFGERIAVAEGRYDVVLFEDGRSFRWDDYLIRGNERVEAGRRPR